MTFDIATLPWAENGDRCFLLVLDIFSRFLELVPMKNQTAQTLIDAFKQARVKNVDGAAMNKLCKLLGIENRHSFPHHPEGDGLAERCIGTVKQVMRCLLTDRELEKTECHSLETLLRIRRRVEVQMK